jgi:hypothetical protein
MYIHVMCVCVHTRTCSTPDNEHTSRHQLLFFSTKGPSVSVSGASYLVLVTICYLLFDASSLANLVHLVVPRFAQKMSSFEKRYYFF